MTIRQNIAFGLELRLVPKPVRQRWKNFRVVVQLQGFGDAPSQLGGHANRVVGQNLGCRASTQALDTNEGWNHI